MPRKRKADSEGNPSQRRVSKQPRKTGSPGQDTSAWPEYFESVRGLKLVTVKDTCERLFVKLFKTFKAINTVLAFVSSKRQLATSFSAVRSSVERLLKQPLEISKVSEIKALLPDLLKFSYISPTEFESHADATSHSGGANSVDYSLTGNNTNIQKGYVLVLDFQDDATKGRRNAVATQAVYASPPAISPAAVKKLIETRNNGFISAVNELLSATSEGEDAVQLLIEAGHTYVPVNHAIPTDDTPSIPIPEQRPPMTNVISDLTSSLWYVDQIAHRRTIGAKEAQISCLEPPLSQRISEAILKARNVQTLYSHQVSAIHAIRSGRHVVVSTSTASGKSMIYQIPLLTFLEDDPDATAILIFPTKALAQDQKASLEHLLSVCPGLDHIRVATYDGDTPQEIRADIRETASIILTNFDTLHASILPGEEKWRSFLKRLKILAVDELHYYTGMLGSHCAQILRRFRRVCAAVGNRHIRFVSCSATLANPSEYMSKMFGLEPNDMEVVSNDGSPSGSKEYLVWNPPLVNSTNPSLGRKSSLTEASNLMRFLMKKGIRVILFCKIRKICELAMKTIKADLSNEGRLDILEVVRAYRGGYTREDRRKIEQEAFTGQLLGIIATNALELGIDIGALDAVIMLGFPFTVSNFKQQAGRAGRRSRDSLAVMVADAFPVDQYYVQNPDHLFEHSLDDLIIDTDNDVILEAHLQCAGYEMPLSEQDEKWFGSSMKEICERRLERDSEGWYHTHPKFLPYPSKHVSIRGAQEEKYMVVEVRDDAMQQSTHVLEDIEFSRALFELYEGGVFMHQGESFIVKEVSHDNKVAKVVRTDVNYITSPRDFTMVEPLQTYRSRSIKDQLVHFGRINVCVKVFGFFKLRGKIILDAVELMTPPYTRETNGFWIELPAKVLQNLKKDGIDGAAAIHAAEHGLLNQFALSQDLKVDCRVVKEEYQEGVAAKRLPRLIFYDAVGTTGGVASRAFDHVHILLERAEKAIGSCPCEDGCTSCIQSNICKDANLISSKVGARIIFNGLLGSSGTGEGISNR